MKLDLSTLPPGAKVGRSLGESLDGLLAPRPADRRGPRRGDVGGAEVGREDGEVLSRIYRPGSTVCRFVVHARPRPWAVSIRRRGRGPAVNPKLVAWQEAVRLAARTAMGGRRPHGGPAELRAVFTLTRAKNGSKPDLVNLTKGAEDAIQGVVILNDRQVTRHLTASIDGDEDMALIEVIAI